MLRAVKKKSSHLQNLHFRKIYDHFTEEEITVEQTRIGSMFRALTPAFFGLILSFAHQVKVIAKELQDKLIHTLQTFSNMWQDCSHYFANLMFENLIVWGFLPKLFLRFDTRRLAEVFILPQSIRWWEDFVAENPNYGMRQSRNRDVYLQGAGQFMLFGQHLEVKKLFVEGREAALKSLSPAVTERKELECRIFKIWQLTN